MGMPAVPRIFGLQRHPWQGHGMHWPCCVHRRAFTVVVMLFSLSRRILRAVADEAVNQGSSGSTAIAKPCVFRITMGVRTRHPRARESIEREIGESMPRGFFEADHDRLSSGSWDPGGKQTRF